MNKPEKTTKSKNSAGSVFSKNNKLTSAISLLFLFFIMFSLFSYIIVGLYRFGLLELPAFIQNLLPKAEPEAEAEKDDKNIYDYLIENSGQGADPSGGEGFSLEITLENIRDVVASTKLPDNLWLECKASYRIDGKVLRTEELELWKKGEKYKYLLGANSVLEEAYTNDAKNELIENFSTGDRAIRAASAAFSFDSVPHLQDINHYLDLLESGEITDYVLSQNSDSNTIEIEYTIAQLDQRELIYISIDTGIVLRVRSYFNGQSDSFYECETTVKAAYYDGDEQAEALAPIEEELFLIG
ncbi:MAG: hypothetical protein FWH48_01290 [Oscillospiraceae bacterium]|nr:hypothetical protein [Oscillospiraceae bacterium]